MPDIEKELSTSFVDKDGKEYFTNTFGGENGSNGVYCMEIVDTKDLIIDLNLEDEMPTFTDGDLGVEVENPEINSESLKNFFEENSEFYTDDEKQTISEALAEMADCEQEYDGNEMVEEVYGVFDKYRLVDLVDVVMEREAFEEISVYAEKLGLTPSNDIEKEMPQKAAEVEQPSVDENDTKLFRVEFNSKNYTEEADWVIQDNFAEIEADSGLEAVEFAIDYMVYDTSSEWETENVSEGKDLREFFEEDYSWRVTESEQYYNGEYEWEHVGAEELRGLNNQQIDVVDQIRDEVTQDVACSLAINSAVSMMSEQFNAVKLLENVTEQFGLDKVSAVIAAQIDKLQNTELGSEITAWAKNISEKMPAQLGDVAIDMTKEQLTDFAKTVMKAEAVRDSVQEVGGMDELLEQLKKSREITNKVLSSENLQDRSAVEAVKLQNSISHAKTAFEQQSNTLPILKNLSEMQLNKLNNLTAKQTELQNKNALLTNKGKRLENRAEKLENTAVMLKALFQNKHIPKPLQAIINKTEQKAAVIRNEKIPKNNMRIDKNLGKMAKNDRKIEVAQCKVDKYQNLSKVIKSFAVIDSSERKKQFTQGLDGLHNASLRSNQLKLAKCEEKIDKLSQKYMDADVSQKFEIMDKLKSQTVKKSSLNEKIEKLQKLEKPFAEQPENVVDKVMDVAKTEIEAQEEAPDRMTAGKFADELCTSCVEAVAEQPKLEQDKKIDVAEQAVQPKNKAAEKSPEKSEKKSVLADIKQIKSEQSKEQKSAPEKAQKKSHSKEAVI